MPTRLMPATCHPAVDAEAEEEGDEDEDADDAIEAADGDAVGMTRSSTRSSLALYGLLPPLVLIMLLTLLSMVKPGAVLLRWLLTLAV